MKRIAALALVLLACGEDARLDRTIATLEPVRGATSLGGEEASRIARGAAEQEIAVADRSLARLALDSGPQLLLDAGSRLTIVDERTVRLAAGRAYAEAGEAEELR